MECLFCSIVKKEIKSFTIYEDEHSVAFLDIHPCSAGHTVCIPKRHMSTFLEMREEEIGGFWEGAQKVLALLKENLSADGFTIGINHGKVSGQSVDHMHLHLIPRYKGDGGGSIHSVVKTVSDDTVEQVYEKITKQT